MSFKSEFMLQSYPMDELSEKEVKIIQKQFMKITNNSPIMTKQEFMESMGILNIKQAEFLIDSIFKLIDEANNCAVIFNGSLNIFSR